MGQRIFVVNPYDTSGIAARINLLDEVREHTLWEIQDAYNFATAVSTRLAKGIDDGKEGVWKKRARDLLAGIILHIKWAREFAGNRSLSTCIDFATDPSTSFEEKLQKIKRYPHDPDYRYGWRTVNGEMTKPTRSSPRKSSSNSTVPKPKPVRLNRSTSRTSRSTKRTWLVSTRRSPTSPSPTSWMARSPPRSTCGSTRKTRRRPCRSSACFSTCSSTAISTDIQPDPVTGRPKVSHDWKCGMILDEFASGVRKARRVRAADRVYRRIRLPPWHDLQNHQQLQEQYGELENITSNLNCFQFGSTRTYKSAEVLQPHDG